MKLRSGKVLPPRVDRLPEELDNLLETELQEFKTLFSSNPQHAKELLHIISGAYSLSCRFSMRDKIEEIYDPNLLETQKLMGGAGALLTFIVNRPEYHNVIHTKMENFDLDTPLLGNIE